MNVADSAFTPLPQDFKPLQLPSQESRPIVDDDPAPGAATALPASGTERDSAGLSFGSVLEALDAGGAELGRAENAENAFANGTGGLQEMVFERAKADSLVSVAAAATSRVAQSLNTLTQIQL